MYPDDSSVRAGRDTQDGGAHSEPFFGDLPAAPTYGGGLRDGGGFAETPPARPTGTPAGAGSSAQQSGQHHGQQTGQHPTQHQGQQGMTSTAAARARAGTLPSLGEIGTVAARIQQAIERVIEGKPDAVRLAVTVMLAEGHLLIEDVPGMGKTMLAKALARAVDCSVKRVQFTPDLLPSDLTGVSIYNHDARTFEFKPGAVFANIVLGDEINRASPKTQSALLECMEEHQVTVDGVTYPLEAPFMVIATQNPVDMEGAYPLPEAQRDRFTARVSMGYPSEASELAMLDHHGATSPLDTLEPVTDAAAVVKVIEAVRTIHVSDQVRRYAIDLVNATRNSPAVRLGASPRSTLQLVRTSRARAALDGRDYVLPDDLQALAVPVLAHRLLLSSDAQMQRRSAEDVVAEIVSRVPVLRSR